MTDNLTDEAVALALGFTQCVARIGAVWWEDASGNRFSLPPFATSIDACAKECERRGWKVFSMNNTGSRAHVTLLVNHLLEDGHGDTLPLAFAKALITAAKETDRG